MSNFDPEDMAELFTSELGRQAATNQVLYNLTRRGIELDLLPRCRQQGLPVMAYSPIEQGRLVGEPVLRRVAERHSVTPAQVAIAWVLAQDGVCAIPKAATEAHVEENRAALDIELSAADLAELDAGFPAPPRPVPLEILWCLLGGAGLGPHRRAGLSVSAPATCAGSPPGAAGGSRWWSPRSACG
ncbi:aldo/keto reductase [Saccharopolyspora sp. NPDC000995]